MAKTIQNICKNLMPNAVSAGTINGGKATRLKKRKKAAINNAAKKETRVVKKITEI